MPFTAIVGCLALFAASSAVHSEEPLGCSKFPCDGALGQIICHGELLAAGYHYNVSDYRLKKFLWDPKDLLEKFRDAQGSGDVGEFFSQNFVQNISGLNHVIPVDWSLKPKSFDGIADQDYRAFAYFLNDRWRNLTRRVDDDVRNSPDRYSLIWVPNPFVVPGGQFQEYFYWDSYWIIKGLLFAGMHTSVENILRNFAYMINQHGLMPNYGRWGVIKRSQPPLFPSMVQEYYAATRNASFVQEMMPALEQEFQFWLNNRSVQVSIDGRSYQLFQYRVDMNCPRPEEYTRDIADATKSTYPPDFVYSSIASAAESGWDFSSRWLDSTGPGAFTKAQCRTRWIVPVDLNSFMCKNMQIMSDFYRMLKDPQQRQVEFMDRKMALINATERVLWNSLEGSWFDFDHHEMKPRRDFYPSNVFPLWSDCYLNPSDKLPKIAQYWNKTGAGRYPGGVPTSLRRTGQQWDFPNAWAPLVHLVIESFNLSGYAPLRQEARKLAAVWVGSNYAGWRRSGQMFEKYDVTHADGQPGGGGEYHVQEGFGWTNGVILDLLRKYGSELKAPTSDAHGKHAFGLHWMLAVGSVLFAVAVAFG